MWTTIRFVGDLDLATVPAARARVVAAFADLGDSTGVELDLRDVDILDSAGLGVVVGALRRARTKGIDVRLRVAAGPVRELITLVGLDRMVDVVTEEASDR